LGRYWLAWFFWRVVYVLASMNCVVTAGPTYEALDEVRRLTNMSTGSLGSELANALSERGHSVVLLLGHYATYRGPQRAAEVRTFTSTEHLGALLADCARGRVGVVYHAAAVSDFRFGRLWERGANGALVPAGGGKVSTRHGTLLAELVPTVKILAGLRAQFPASVLVGWKYEVDGDRECVIAKGRQQLAECGTDGCVLNGRAYGAGFGVLDREGGLCHTEDKRALFELLARRLEEGGGDVRTRNASGA
jgi:phosphopantothenoylcysteine decarboxylase/phosphopantothenate--cysteine ligase